MSYVNVLSRRSLCVGCTLFPSRQSGRVVFLSLTQAAAALSDTQRQRKERWWKVILFLPSLAGRKGGGRKQSLTLFYLQCQQRWQPTDMTKPICKRCFKAVKTKGANTTNLAKHLSDRHPDLYKEVKERQARECDR